MSEENVEIVRRLIDCWNRADYEKALKSIDPEIEVDAAFGTDLDGAYRGHEGITRMLAGFWREFEDSRIEIEQVIPVGTELLVAVRFYGRGRRSGAEVEAPAWHVWTLRGGKAVRWWVRRTRPEALEAAGLSE